MKENYTPVTVLPALPREEANKLIVFTAGTKGGVGKSSIMPFLYTWYRTVVNIQPVCVDFDPEVGSFFKCISGANVAPLDLSSISDFLGSHVDTEDTGGSSSFGGDQAVGFVAPTLQDLLSYVREADQTVFLVDLPASSKGTMEDLLKDFDPDTFELMGIRLVFLHVHCNVADNTAVETSQAWLEYLQGVPHVPFAITNHRDGGFDYPDDFFLEQFAGRITLDKIDPVLNFTAPTSTPFPYMVMSFMTDAVGARVMEFVGRKDKGEDFSDAGITRKKFMGKFHMEGVEKKWDDSRVKRLNPLRLAGLALDKVFQGFAKHWEVFTLPEMDEAVQAFDKEAGFTPRKLEDAYGVVRMMPDPGPGMNSWNKLVPLRDLIVSFFGSEVPAPAPAAAKVEEKKAPAFDPSDKKDS